MAWRSFELARSWRLAGFDGFALSRSRCPVTRAVATGTSVVEVVPPGTVVLVTVVVVLPAQLPITPCWLALLVGVGHASANWFVLAWFPVRVRLSVPSPGVALAGA